MLTFIQWADLYLFGFICSLLNAAADSEAGAYINNYCHVSQVWKKAAINGHCVWTVT